MINPVLNSKNFLKFLIVTLLFVFGGGALLPAGEASAAAVGKKKKGYSAKNNKAGKTSAAKASVKAAPAAAKTGPAAASKAAKVKKAQAAAAPSVEPGAEEIDGGDEFQASVTVPASSAKTASYEAAKKTAAKVSPTAVTAKAPLRAISLSSNNYYESRYSELTEKSNNRKSESEKIFIQDKNTVMKNPVLASRMVISSDGGGSHFERRDNASAAKAARTKKKAAKSSYYEPVEETYLSRNAKTKNLAVEKDGKAAGGSKAEPAPENKGGFFSKYLGNSESRLKWFPGLYLNLGANVLENPDTGARKMWSKLGAIPRFSYNNISFAYDLTFYFDENNNMRKTDWDSFDDYIRKIYYAYYGKPGDRLSARVEMIDDFTLGSGAIFRNYCGSLRYPLLDKKVGGVLTFDTGFDDYIKLFVDDIASPGIYAASFEIMPHDHVQVGAQLVSDNKVNTGFRNENVTVGSLHVGIPLSSKYNSKFKIYEEIGKIRNFGMGMHTGVVAETADFIFKTEFRSMSQDYIPNYFDTLYEMERHYKGRALIRLRDGDERVTGWFNEFKAKIAEAYTFRLSYEKDYSAFLKPHLSIGIDYTGMEYNKLKLSANYDRKNLYYSNSRVSDAIYGLKARYDISDSSSMCYELRHVLNEYGKAVDSINIETQLKF